MGMAKLLVSMALKNTPVRDGGTQRAHAVCVTAAFLFHCARQSHSAATVDHPLDMPAMRQWHASAAAVPRR